MTHCLGDTYRKLATMASVSIKQAEETFNPCKLTITQKVVRAMTLANMHGHAASWWRLTLCLLIMQYLEIAMLT